MNEHERIAALEEGLRECVGELLRAGVSRSTVDRVQRLLWKNKESRSNAAKTTSITVGKLMECLRDFSPEMPVVIESLDYGLSPIIGIEQFGLSATEGDFLGNKLGYAGCFEGDQVLFITGIGSKSEPQA